MEQQRTLHIVGGTSRSRAEQARIAFALGHHAEVYADLAELVRRPVAPGVVLAGGELLETGIGQLIDRLGAAGIWLPVVAVAEAPGVPDVVRAIEEGALDFLPLPLAHSDLARMLAKLGGAGERHVAARRSMVEAQRRMAALSRRERQVLDWLAEGSSNKLIARALAISPRTVEIHRANMMDKLGVQHSAEAVRLQCIAGLASTAHGAAADKEAGAATAPFRLVGRAAASSSNNAASLRRAA
jgi:FixJ family two-component response regulator